jgi:hypothetical protein
VHLKGLTKLRRLNLWGSEITDAALPQLKDLTQLKELGVEVAEVTRAGVAELKKALPNTRIGHINDLPWLPLGGIESQP